MEKGKLYPVAYVGDIFLKRNIIGNFYLVNERERVYTSIGFVEAIGIFTVMPNATIPFESAFDIE